MRRVALPLPTARLAASKVYRTGKFVSGTGTGFNSPFDILMVGTDNTIHVDAGILSRYPSENPEVICFSFSSGTVAVKNPAGRTAFTDRLSEGMIVSKLGSVDVETTVSLLPKPGVAGGSLDFTGFSKQGAHRASSGPGHASVFVATATTEPRALGMVGAGLIGLAGLARRTLKVPT